MNPEEAALINTDVLPPNQVTKREEIFASTVGRLLHDGVSCCTLRSIAALSGVDRSAERPVAP